jgi:CheY-like chemotaxis protein
LQAKKVLIASNSKLFSRTLTRVVDSNKYEVTTVVDGNEVLASIENIDLCLLQDSLANVTGLEICQQLRHSEQKNKPIIIFSHQSKLEDEALEKGASAFLKIPCHSEDVLKLIEKWLDFSTMGVSQKTKLTTATEVEIAPSTDDEIQEIDTVTGEEEKQETILPQGTQSTDSQPSCILLVDDSRLIHASVGKIIDENGFKLIRAMDGVEGLQKAVEYIPDLIISDLDMPNMNGYEMCQEIKQREVTQDIPVVILSARGAGLDIDKGFDVGANDFLTKPVDEAELISRINLTLGSQGENSLREKILVVDDSALVRNMMKQGLSQQGFEILTANDGQEGYDAAVEHEPDLIVTDFNMPKMDGRELTRALKSREALSDIPVLMLTAADSDTDQRKGKHAGVAAFLSKPFPPDKLVVIAEKLIAERRLIRERQAMRHYLSESAVKAAAAAADQKSTVDQMRVEEAFLTIFFTDIVGFTPMTERMDPGDLVNLLNEYFDEMVVILKENGATIDKFVGDAIMALYLESKNRSREECAYNAVKAGLEMIEALRKFNENRQDQVNIRVGINSGTVIMGDIGSKLYRRDYTVIGDNVNIAARLESSAEKGSVLVSDTTYKLIKDFVEIENTSSIVVKGKAEELLVHKVSQLLPI